MPHQLASIVAGARRHRLEPASTGVLEGAAIRLAVDNPGSEAFAHVARHRGLHDGLRGLFRELRLHNDEQQALEALGRRGTVPSAAVAAYRRYLDLVGAHRDAPELARLAAERAEAGAGAWAASLGALVVYLPQRLDEATIRLLAALGRRSAVLAAGAAPGRGFGRCPDDRRCNAAGPTARRRG